MVVDGGAVISPCFLFFPFTLRFASRTRFSLHRTRHTMYLMYTLDAAGKRVYTLKVRRGESGEEGTGATAASVSGGGRRLSPQRPVVAGALQEARRPLFSRLALLRGVGWKPACTLAVKTAPDNGVGAGGHGLEGGALPPAPPAPHAPRPAARPPLTPVPPSPKLIVQKYVGDTPTHSAHPARFSPDDKFSRERVECKRRFNLLPTQQPAPVL
jgi:hypothetical protein